MYHCFGIWVDASLRKVSLLVSWATTQIEHLLVEVHMKRASWQSDFRSYSEVFP